MSVAKPQSGTNRETNVTAKIITVDIARRDGGWLVGTSKEIPGLYIAHQDIREIIDDVPSVIQAMIKVETGQDVRLIQVDSDDESEGYPWVMLPPEVISNHVQ